MTSAESSATHSLLSAEPDESDKERVKRVVETHIEAGKDNTRNKQLNIGLKQRTYTQQYANIYFLRLLALRAQLEQRCHDSWGTMAVSGRKVQHMDRVLDIRQGQLVWVVGTVYRDMKLKPNILDDIARDKWGAPTVANDRYSDPATDLLTLEDESGRINLVGEMLDQELLVTGIVIGVLGTETPEGDFDVVDIRFPELAPQPNNNKSENQNGNGGGGGGGPRYLAIVSGLSLDAERAESPETQLLLEYLTGQLGDSRDQQVSSRIEKLIIAGNSIVPTRVHQDDKDKKTATKYNHDIASYILKPTDPLDAWLAQTASSICIDLMPGPADPAEVSLPQQPIHFTLLPQSKPYIQAGALISTTNPSWLELGSRTIFGTSGQNISDLTKYTCSDSTIRPLDLMELTLRWRHAVPTAPDTLTTYPFKEHDPFVLDTTPHVYFAGNQPEFDTRLIEEEIIENNNSLVKCRLVAVPEFSKTGKLVLVNLETLECDTVDFACFK